MKKLLLLLPILLVLSLATRGQTIQSTPATPHTLGTPTHTPSTYGSNIAYDKTNKIFYRWTGSAWTAGLPGSVTDGDKGDVTVSGSGTSWQLDAGAVGNTEIASGAGGIYKGSGTVPASTVATATNGFSMNSGASGQILLGDYGSAGLGGNLNLQGSGAILGTPGYQFRAQADDAYIQTVSPGYTVRLEPTTAYTLIQSTATNGYKFWDTRATPRGVEYSGDYSATYNDRSLMDFGSVKALVSDSIATVSGGGGGASYLVYTALLSQSGTDAPTATVLENTLGGTVVWTWEDVGFFRGTLTSAFPSAKTWATASIDLVAAADEFFARIARESDNLVKVQIFDAAVAAINGCNNMAIEIRVYP